MFAIDYQAAVTVVDWVGRGEAVIPLWVCGYCRGERGATERHNNGGDYDEWLRVVCVDGTAFAEFRSSADFPYCPDCGRYEDHGLDECPGPDAAKLARVGVRLI